MRFIIFGPTTTPPPFQTTTTTLESRQYNSHHIAIIADRSCITTIRNFQYFPTFHPYFTIPPSMRTHTCPMKFVQINLTFINVYHQPFSQTEISYHWHLLRLYWYQLLFKQHKLHQNLKDMVLLIPTYSVMHHWMYYIDYRNMLGKIICTKS